MKNYQKLAKALDARQNCINSNNIEWQEKWESQIEEIVKQFPSGSGFDNGTKLDIDASSGEKLVFATAFHHMNDGGYYDGWTEHIVTVIPSLSMEYRVKVSGQNRNEIKDYIHEQFSFALDEETLTALDNPLPVS